MRYRKHNANGKVLCIQETFDGEVICSCRISVNEQTHSWSITSWHTRDGFKNSGRGKATMREALQYCIRLYGMPESVCYIWNGANAYVLEWIEKHFNAACTCPLAVQKNQADDDWNSHIYNLDRAMVLQYFKLV